MTEYMTKKKKTTKKTKKTAKKAVKKATRTRKPAKKSKLSVADLKKYEDILLAKRAEILGNVSSMKENSISNNRSDLSKVPFHMADAGSDNYEMENTLGLMDEEIRILKEIDAALVRMERGTYGICDGSGDPIPKARLNAIPWARFTVQFKELLEKGLVTFDENLEEFEDDDEDYEGLDDDELVDEDEDEDIDEEEELDEAMVELDKHMVMMGDGDDDDEEEE